MALLLQSRGAVMMINNRWVINERIGVDVVTGSWE
jgi:hypothetical protein